MNAPEHHTRDDELIARIVVGDADALEWSEFFDRTTRDDGLFRSVVLAQRDQAELGWLIDDAAALSHAARIDHGATPSERTPSERTHRGPAEHFADTARHDHHDHHDADVDGQRSPGESDAAIPQFVRPSRSADPEHADVRIRPRWRDAGWLVAACLLCALLVSVQRAGPTGAPELSNTMHAGLAPVMNAQEAWDAYMEKGVEEGRILTRQPRKILIESRPAETGPGVEVIYVLQTVERRTVMNLYQVEGLMENGRPTLAPVSFELPLGGSM